MAAFAVLEDIVNGAIGRERVLRERICWHMMTTGSSAVLRAILLELRRAAAGVGAQHSEE